MKENITKFDINAAFKALDEIGIPKVSGLRPNRVSLAEEMKRVDKTAILLEDYYDIGNTEELEEAQAGREEEIAKAKLARIEKIVDLDADSPEDLLPSYVGKTIIQCPQCMTLFYKNEEDLVKDENDPEVVNVNEPCQHCGNISGYSVIGKVAEAEKDELDNFEAEIPTEENPEETELDFEEEPMEKVEEEPVEEVEEEEISEEPEEEKLDLKDEEEKKEESFVKPQGESLVEQVEDVLTEAADEDLNKKLEAHNKYIAHVQEKIAAAEKELAEEKNEEIKKLIEKTINAYKEELEAALPEAVKEEQQVEELPDADEVPEEAIEGEEVEESLGHKKLKEALRKLKLKESADDLKVKNKLIKLLSPQYGKLLKRFDVKLTNRVNIAALDTINNILYINDGFLADDDTFRQLPTIVKHELSHILLKHTGYDHTKDDKEIWNKIYTDDDKKIARNIKVNGKDYYDMGALEETYHGNPGDDFSNDAEAMYVARELVYSLVYDAKTARRLLKNINYDNLETNEQIILDDLIADALTGANEHEVAMEYLHDKLPINISDEISNTAHLDALIKSCDDLKQKLELLFNAINTLALNGILSESLKEEAKTPEVKLLNAFQRFNLVGFKGDLSKISPAALSKAARIVYTSKTSPKELSNIVNNSKVPTLIVIDSKIVDDSTKARIPAIINAIDESLKEETAKEFFKLEDTDAAVDELFDSKEFNTPIGESAEIDEFDEESLNEHLTAYLKEVYENVKSFEATAGSISKNKLVLEGTINFKSGNSRNTCFEFVKKHSNPAHVIYEGINEDFAKDTKFTLTCKLNKANLITESIGYSYTINNTLVEGLK